MSKEGCVAMCQDSETYLRATLNRVLEKVGVLCDFV